IIWTSLPGRDSNDLRDWRIRAALRPSRDGCGGARCDLSATFGREKSNPAIDCPAGGGGRRHGRQTIRRVMTESRLERLAISSAGSRLSGDRRSRNSRDPERAPVAPHRQVLHPEPGQTTSQRVGIDSERLADPLEAEQIVRNSQRREEPRADLIEGLALLGVGALGVHQVVAYRIFKHRPQKPVLAVETRGTPANQIIELAREDRIVELIVRKAGFRLHDQLAPGTEN